MRGLCPYSQLDIFYEMPYFVLLDAHSIMLNVCSLCLEASKFCINGNYFYNYFRERYLQKSNIYVYILFVYVSSVIVLVYGQM